MRLVEKKCPNCGASIKFNNEDKEVECTYCHAHFDIEKDPEDKIVDNFILHAKTIRTMSKSIFIIAFIIIIIIMITFIIMF